MKDNRKPESFKYTTDHELQRVRGWNSTKRTLDGKYFECHTGKEVSYLTLKYMTYGLNICFRGSVKITDEELCFRIFIHRKLLHAMMGEIFGYWSNKGRDEAREQIRRALGVFKDEN